MLLINYKDFTEKDRWFARFQIDTIQDFDNFYGWSKSCNTLQRNSAPSYWTR